MQLAKHFAARSERSGYENKAEKGQTGLDFGCYVHGGKIPEVVACFPGLKNMLVTSGRFTVIEDCLENQNLNPAPPTGKL